jgi:hypothetical protein
MEQNWTKQHQIVDMQVIYETYLWLHEMTNTYDEVHKALP